MFSAKLWETKVKAEGFVSLQTFCRQNFLKSAKFSATASWNSFKAIVSRLLGSNKAKICEQLYIIKNYRCLYLEFNDRKLGMINSSFTKWVYKQNNFQTKQFIDKTNKRTQQTKNKTRNSLDLEHKNLKQQKVYFSSSMRQE